MRKNTLGDCYRQNSLAPTDVGSASAPSAERIPLLLSVSQSPAVMAFV